jgi:glycosyltransferase involved in cell wall biosynthesis
MKNTSRSYQKTKGKNTVKNGYNCDRTYLEDNVVFINEYVELKQLLEYLTLSDIYLFSSKDPKPGRLCVTPATVISTPIPHAVEMLAQSTGILLNKFDDSEEFKEAILWLIENKEELVWARMLFAVSRNLLGKYCHSIQTTI